MQKQVDSSKLLKTIQVKGMNGLSLSYIQRFFSHSGQVEQVKKIQDLVIVRFKHQASTNKALRFNGRVIDKQPIKIRCATPYISLQQMPHKKQNFRKESSKKIDQLDQAIMNRAFDVPFFWASILKFISKLSDNKINWLLHQIFFIKLSQIIHFHAFGTNPRSTYLQITIKQNFVNENKNNINLVQHGEGKIQKLQIMSIPSNDLLDQPNFQCFLSNVNTRLKVKFRQMFKALQGDRLFQLYSLFHAYSLYIPKQQSIFSLQNNLDKNEQYSVSKQFVTQQRARISLQDVRQNQLRSQYRQIDNEHPSKQIQILSDSCFNEQSFEFTTYDIFRDDFDGNITNNCAADIFFHHRFHYVANYIIIRYREAGKLHYFRLDFELRLTNCEDEILGTKDFCRFLQYGDEGVIEEITQIKMFKHNVVISDFEKIEKVVYLVENYIRFVINNGVIVEQQPKQNLLGIYLILSNPTQNNQAIIRELTRLTFQNQTIAKVGVKIFLIRIQDHAKFEKYKCSNFIQQYVDQLKGAFNMEIARMHAKKLIEQNPNKFGCIPTPEDFATQTIWKLEQDKSKRQAKNRIKMQVHHVRNK